VIAKFDGKCRKCGAEYRAGESVRWSNLTKQVFCINCWGNKSEQTTRNKSAMAAIMARATDSLSDYSTRRLVFEVLALAETRDIVDAIQDLDLVTQILKERLTA
jgi:hypothetical protein